MLTKEEWAAWRRSSETKEFMRYLKDRRRLRADQWAGMAFQSQSLVGQQNQVEALILGQLVELEYEAIEKFYEGIA